MRGGIAPAEQMFDKRWTDTEAALSVHRQKLDAQLRDEDTNAHAVNALRFFSGVLCGTLLWTLTGLSLYGTVVSKGMRDDDAGRVACGYCLWAYSVMRVTLATLCFGCLLVGGGPEALTQCSRWVWGGIGAAILIGLACIGGCVAAFKPLPALTQCTEPMTHTAPYLSAACCLFVYCDMTILLGCTAAAAGAAGRAAMLPPQAEEEEAPSNAEK